MKPISNIEKVRSDNKVVGLDIFEDSDSSFSDPQFPSDDDAQLSEPNTNNARSEHATINTASAPQRRSTHQSECTLDWRIAPTACHPADNAKYLEVILNAFINQEPQRYAEATSPQNIDLWAPRIKCEQDCIHENKTATLVKRQPGIHLIPCRYVFKSKIVVQMWELL